LTKKTYEDNSTAVFEYDKIGNMTKAENDDSTVTFDYENVYRLIETTQKIYSYPTRTIEYDYDAAGNRTAMTDPNLTGQNDPKVEYTYNSLNQLASITDVYNNATNYYYDAGGTLTNRTYGNGAEADYAYDAVNRLTLLENKKSDDSEISTFFYEHDKAGNRTKRADDPTSSTKTLKYSYDNIYEVTEVYHVQGPEVLEEFSYDGVGNRTADSDYNNYSYNSNNQLTSYDSMTLTYDKNGNLTKKTETGVGDTTYSYNYENRLVRIDYPDSDYSTYKYDALGRRIEKRDTDGAISRYVYDGQNMVAEYDGSNNIVANYIQSLGIDRPISMYRGGEMYWYHKDALGSIYQMTDEDETVVRTYDYSAFGTIISETGSLINPFTYTAREYDEDSGLYYYRARYYDPAVGRFLQRDPFFALGFVFYESQRNDPVYPARILLGNAAALDNYGYDVLYRYGRNNPLNRVDPYGLVDWCKICNIGCAVGCGIICYSVCFTVCTGTGGWGCIICIALCSASVLSQKYIYKDARSFLRWNRRWQSMRTALSSHCSFSRSALYC